MMRRTRQKNKVCDPPRHASGPSAFMGPVLHPTRQSVVLCMHICRRTMALYNQRPPAGSQLRALFALGVPLRFPCHPPKKVEDPVVGLRVRTARLAQGCTGRYTLSDDCQPEEYPRPHPADFVIVSIVYATVQRQKGDSPHALDRPIPRLGHDV